MATAALAFTLLNSNFEQWNTDNIDVIMATGHLYYQDCLENVPPQYRQNGMLEAPNLYNKLIFTPMVLTVLPAVFPCGEGPTNEDNVLKTLLNFNRHSINTAILTCADYSYGLIKFKNQESDVWKLIFFDSHGRDNDGNRVHPEVDGSENGKAAILFFENVINFKNFFIKQNSPYRLFSLYPIDFVLENSSEDSVPPLPASSAGTEITIVNEDPTPSDACEIAEQFKKFHFSGQEMTHAQSLSTNVLDTHLPLNYEVICF